MMTMLQELEPHALEALAIFPLPDAVLLPGGLLPLHVFEPRYRAMTRDCLAGSRVMAIARLDDTGHGEGRRPPVFPSIGLGRIIASDELADGRFLIVLRGIARAHIERELPATRPYRLVRASLVGDAPACPVRSKALHGQLVAMCDRLAFTLDRGGDELRALAHAAETPGECAVAVAAALIMDPGERQHLLETPDPIERLERTASHVGRLVCQLAPCVGPPN
jgi:Lon protease-like protein